MAYPVIHRKKTWHDILMSSLVITSKKKLHGVVRENILTVYTLYIYSFGGGFFLISMFAMIELLCGSFGIIRSVH